MKNSLFNIQLSKFEKIWLERLYEKIKNNEDISYKIISLELSDILPPGFNTKQLNHKIVSEDGVYISILGINAIDQELDIFENANNTIKAIKKYLINNPKVEHIMASDISKILNLSEPKVGLIFKLIQPYGRFSNASGSNHNYYGCSSLNISNDHNNEVIDQYLNFSSIEDLIIRFYEKLSQREKIVNLNSLENNIKTQTNYEFVNYHRIEELKSIKNSKFNFTRLIRYCEELNICYKNECYLSVSMLNRAIIDHIPPLFESSNFKTMNSQKGNNSFKKHMIHLDNSLRQIANRLLHTPIRKKESLPNNNQVNFSPDLDALLGEICRIYIQEVK